MRGYLRFEQFLRLPLPRLRRRTCIQLVKSQSVCGCDWLKEVSFAWMLFVVKVQILIFSVLTSIPYMLLLISGDGCVVVMECFLHDLL